jgi:hypothetical protein
MQKTIIIRNPDSVWAALKLMKDNIGCICTGKKNEVLIYFTASEMIDRKSYGIIHDLIKRYGFSYKMLTMNYVSVHRKFSSPFFDDPMEDSSDSSDSDSDFVPE